MDSLYFQVSLTGHFGELPGKHLLVQVLSLPPGPSEQHPTPISHLLGTPRPVRPLLPEGNRRLPALEIQGDTDDPDARCPPTPPLWPSL